MAVERFVKSEPVGAQRRTADRDIFEALVRPHARQRFPAAGASVSQGVWVWLSTAARALGGWPVVREILSRIERRTREAVERLGR